MQRWSQALPARLYRGAGWPTNLHSEDTTLMLISLEGLSTADWILRLTLMLI